MNELTRQQLCAALSISESTVYRLERDGLPYTPVGRSKRYNLAECKAWLRENLCPSGATKPTASMSGSWSAANEFTDACRQVHLRVMPS